MLLIQGIYKSIFNRIRSKNVSNLLSKRMYIQSGAKIVKLIAKERLLGPTSPIINVELEFEGSGRALHYFSTLIQGWGVGGGEGGKLGSLKNFCSWLFIFWDFRLWRILAFLTFSTCFRWLNFSTDFIVKWLNIGFHIEKHHWPCGRGLIRIPPTLVWCVVGDYRVFRFSLINTENLCLH